MSEEGVIEQEGSRVCMECGSVDETRPYGPGGKEICFRCFDNHPEWLEEGGERFMAMVEGRPPRKTEEARCYVHQIADCGHAHCKKAPRTILADRGDPDA